MGMKRAEIERKFDQIVEFSGIADFIDTPVRRYSSGMNARLGFSIAAHLEPQVLIVDEVLAVGDFAFQQRAFGRIQEMVNQDVTTILVSHQLERIASLCTRAVLLRRGEVAHAGSGRRDDWRLCEWRRTRRRRERATDSPLLIRSAELVTDGPIVSGSRIQIRVDVRRRRSGSGRRHVRRRRPGAIDAERKGALRHLVDASGRLAQRADAVSRSTSRSSSIPRRASTPLKQSCSIGSASSSIANGPWVTVTVQEGKSFHGEVQMNPEMTLRSPESIGERRETARLSRGATEATAKVSTRHWRPPSRREQIVHEHVRRHRDPRARGAARTDTRSAGALPSPGGV